MSPLLAIGALLGAKGRWRGITGLAAAIVAAVALFGLLWGAAAWIMGRHDARVIEADRAAGSAAVLANVVEADRAAGAAKDRRDRADLDRIGRTMEAINAAELDDHGDPLRAGLDQLRPKARAACAGGAARPREAGALPCRR